MAEKKDATVVCPCCDSRIEVDLLSGKILRWSRPEELDETGKPVVSETDWAEANQRVAQRKEKAADLFEAGLAREKSREKDLDDLFKKAKDKQEKKDFPEL